MIVAGVFTAGLTVSGTAHAEHRESGYSPCRPAETNGEDRFGYSDDADADGPGHELPTVYTDGADNYVGVCGGNESAGTDSYAQLNNVNDAANGRAPLLEGQTGEEAVDAQVWGDGTESYGPATLWIAGGGPAGTGEACAPAGDDEYVHANGNTVTRQLPTLYLNSDFDRAGVCGGGGYAQLNNVNDAAKGQDSLVEGQTGQASIDEVLFPFGPASIWLTNGPESGSTASCAGEGDDTYLYSNSNLVSRELPTVYSDPAASDHVGVCGGSGDSVVVTDPKSGDPAQIVVINGPTVPTAATTTATPATVIPATATPTVTKILVSWGL